MRGVVYILHMKPLFSTRDDGIFVLFSQHYNIYISCTTGLQQYRANWYVAREYIFNIITIFRYAISSGLENVCTAVFNEGNCELPPPHVIYIIGFSRIQTHNNTTAQWSNTRGGNLRWRTYRINTKHCSHWLYTKRIKHSVARTIFPSISVLVAPKQGEKLHTNCWVPPGSRRLPVYAGTRQNCRFSGG